MSRADAGHTGSRQKADGAGRQAGGRRSRGVPGPAAPVGSASSDAAPVGDAASTGSASSGSASSGSASSGSPSGGPTAGSSADAAADVSADPKADTASDVVASGVTAPRRAPWAGWDPTIRVAGVVISIVAAFVSGVFELLLTTLRAGDFGTVWRGDAIGSGGGPLIPVSILLAVVLNYGIAWFAVSTTRRRWALGPPWALWTLMMLAASGIRTTEGDYLLGGTNWVALVMILVGSLTFAVYSYRMILKRVRP